jgi:uncharacterized protein YuzE
MAIKYTYDEEGDILSITFAPGEKGMGIELNDNILLRINPSEGKALGLTLLDFSVLAQVTELGPRSFPLTGLADLSEELRDLVIRIITSSPVDQFLKVSLYTPPLAEPIPLTTIQRPTAPVP